MNAIEITGLTKVYSSAGGRNKVEALKNVSLSVERGAIFGLLGPNGAGKTTLIKILLGITFPTHGTALMLNTPIDNYLIRKRIGFLPENHKYPNFLTGGEVLKYFGRLTGSDISESRIDELLQLVNLTKWKKSKIKTYSKGMMQRLGLAQALLADPDVLFLDEPTDGVDPIGRKEIRDLIKDLKSKGKTIFLNSHLLSEVELVTDRVAILNKGTLLREGTVNELTEKKEEYLIETSGVDISETAPGAGFLLTKDPVKGKYILKVDDIEALNRFIDYLREKQILLKSVVPVKSSLEEMFINIINESDGGAAK